jgi:hypothetical protein
MMRAPMKRTGFAPRIKPVAGILRTATLKPAKQRKCAICRTPFSPWPLAAKVCSVECGAAAGHLKTEKDQRIAAKRQAAAERKDIAARKDAIKSRPDWIVEAQQAFNAFIRARDADKNCICCGKPFEPQRPGGSIDAGHYLSRGSASHLRFDERNCHAQRKNCNRPGGTTRAAFRIGMEARIGLEALEALESDQQSRDWTKDDLRAIRDTYRAKLKALQKECA